MVDLIGGNKQTEEQLKAKKWMKIIGVILILLLIICIALVYLVYHIQKTQLKISVNDVSKAQLGELLIFEEDDIYIPIRDFAQYVGYTSYSGDYKQYSEDSTKCYVESNNEIASFALSSNKIYKTNGSSDYEYYEIDKPVKMMNEKLYTTIEGAEIAFNIQFSYNKQNNSIKIYTLPHLVTYYASKITNADLAQENFNNQKALLYNMVVVKNTYGHYGVNALNGTEIIGAKYASIEFIESTREFIVTTDEKKMGIMSHNATTKISPEYDNIKQVDKDAGLYLATNNDKNGILDSNGNIVLYLEYEQIGIDSSKFITNNIKNQYLLYDTCIPVKRNGLWGLYDKNGKEILETKYSSLGCTVGSGISGDKAANNILLIPEYNAIVVKEGEYYGIVDINGKTLIPSALTSVYSTTTSGKETYYMIYKEQVINVIDYLNERIKNQENTNQSTNTQTNTTTNNQNVNTQDNVTANNQNANAQVNAITNNQNVNAQVNDTTNNPNINTQDNTTTNNPNVNVQGNATTNNQNINAQHNVTTSNPNINIQTNAN